MAALKIADLFALSPGHTGEHVDAEMAYTQAEFRGPTTWVGIPKEQWPASWFDSKGQTLHRNPVCKLLRALYGHPDAGGIWARHCDDHLRSVGFCRDSKLAQRLPPRGVVGVVGGLYPRLQSGRTSGWFEKRLGI